MIPPETRTFTIWVDREWDKGGHDDEGNWREPAVIFRTQETVEITVDWAWLASYVGRQAVMNKSGKSSEVAKAITARHERPRRKRSTT